MLPARPGVQQVLVAAALAAALLACGAGNKKQIAESRAMAHYRLAGRYFQGGKVRAALQELNQAIELRPKNADYREFLGLVYFSLGQYELAEEEYRLALELNPALTDAHVHLALVFSETERYQEAERHYRAALSDPSYLTPEQAYMNWGLTLLKQRDISGAESKFREAISVSPRYPRGHFELANLLHRQGDREAALREYLLAWQVGWSDRPELNLKLGELYLARGEPSEAVLYLEKVIAVAPAGPEAARARTLLDRANSR